MPRAGVVIGAGAAAGLGGALARRIASEGLPLYVCGRTQSKLDALSAAIGKGAVGVAMDCTQEADVVRLFEQVEKETGAPPELVIYNAGNNRFSGLLDMSNDMFEDLWRVCAFGAFLVGREAARRMVPAGGGTLIYTGATASLRARPPFTAFASAKAAERAVAHGIAREFGPKGLHVGHVIVDGVINGDQVNTRLPQLKERLGDDGMLDPDAMAAAFWSLHHQDKTAWTLELDLRPYREQF